MKIKKSPKILALHLKRFKYTEDMQRNLKLFHRVVYPPTLRLFNTTDDADDPEKMYELYAVVVHIGGGPYHGHYVTIVKNDETGNWMLIDDEAVEAVDDGFVGRFYGDRPGMASAYVLFYQEVEQKLIEPEDIIVIPNGKPLVAEMPSIANGIAKIELSEKRPVNGYGSQNSLDSFSRVSSSPAVSRVTRMPSLATVEEKAPVRNTPPTSPSAEEVVAPLPKTTSLERTPTKKETKDAAKREKEERKERDKREKAKQREKEGKKLGRSSFGTIKRWGKDKDKDKDKDKS
jgi:ubiquitin carboxyl-terminal hydrolase 9/13